VSLRALTRVCCPSTSSSGRVEGGQLAEELPNIHTSRGHPERDLFGGRVREPRDRGMFRRIRTRVSDGSSSGSLESMREHEFSRERIQGAFRVGSSNHRESLRRFARSGSWFRRSSSGLERERYARSTALWGREAGRRSDDGSGRLDASGRSRQDSQSGPRAGEDAESLYRDEAARTSNTAKGAWRDVVTAQSPRREHSTNTVLDVRGRDSEVRVNARRGFSLRW